MRGAQTRRMASPRRDLGTRGRVAVAALGVGTAAALAGWMALTDHTASTDTVASTGTAADSGSVSSTPSAFDDDRTVAVPGSTASYGGRVPDARTGGS
jgi:hypothetical protein